ncbi:phage major tail tube protein [Brevibacillus reuszeri]|uniref:phage major tail tube protein n=1 Tax=Brevibacillus reuszeri TaxID=54915 RepID=UPI001B0075B6|nr:phage major tail tube protein [Brevibacillus reuszeri]GIO09670.1 phage major tail tube protein [Brevibacillus reuszeri]
MAGVNTVPERLTNFRIYLDGSNDLKGVADLQLPSFEPMTDTVKGAGIGGEYEAPTIGHFQSMKLTINWRSVTREMFSLLRQKGQRLDCRGAFQDYDAGKATRVTRSVRVVVQGPTTKVDPGKYEVGSSSDGSAEIEVMYLKIEIEGRTVVELDKLNFVFMVDGEDQFADVRKALGM